MSRPWVEKYRPNLIKDIEHQDSVKSAFNDIVKTHQMPHLLLFGPPGTGKTTAILALCYELFGTKYRQRIRELNASDDRGIKAIQGNVKSFAEQLPAYLPEENGKAPANYKVLILDEADNMTREAQTCLRRTIEDQSKYTRFVFICNYVSKIIPPLISRCASFRFEPISRLSQQKRISFVAESEGLKVEPDAIEHVLNTAEGDMRTVLNVLQTAASLSNEIDLAAVQGVTGEAPRELVVEVLNCCLKEDRGAIKRIVEELHCDGWDVKRMLKSLLYIVRERKDLNDVQKATIAGSLAATQAAMLKGCNEYISLLHVALEIHNLRPATVS